MSTSRKSSKAGAADEAGQSAPSPVPGEPATQESRTRSRAQSTSSLSDARPELRESVPIGERVYAQVAPGESSSSSESSPAATAAVAATPARAANAVPLTAVRGPFPNQGDAVRYAGEDPDTTPRPPRAGPASSPRTARRLVGVPPMEGQYGPSDREALLLRLQRQEQEIEALLRSQVGRSQQVDRELHEGRDGFDRALQEAEGVARRAVAEAEELRELLMSRDEGIPTQLHHPNMRLRGTTEVVRNNLRTENLYHYPGGYRTTHTYEAPPPVVLGSEEERAAAYDAGEPVYARRTNPVTGNELIYDRNHPRGRTVELVRQQPQQPQQPQRVFIESAGRLSNGQPTANSARPEGGLAIPYSGAVPAVGSTVTYSGAVPAVGSTVTTMPADVWENGMLVGGRAHSSFVPVKPTVVWPNFSGLPEEDVNRFVFAFRMTVNMAHVSLTGGSGISIMVTQCLRGAASAWAYQVLGEWDIEASSTETFIASLIARWGDPFRLQRARVQLDNLRQEGDLESFVSKFQDLDSKIGGDVAGRIHAFTMRLQPAVATFVLTQCPTSLEGAIRAARTFSLSSGLLTAGGAKHSVSSLNAVELCDDDELHRRMSPPLASRSDDEGVAQLMAFLGKALRKSHHGGYSSASGRGRDGMSSSPRRSAPPSRAKFNISQELYDDRLRKGVCLACGRAGHRALDCRSKPNNSNSSSPFPSAAKSA